jgi:hypothetical protein
MLVRVLLATSSSPLYGFSNFGDLRKKQAEPLPTCSRSNNFSMFLSTQANRMVVVGNLFSFLLLGGLRCASAGFVFAVPHVRGDENLQSRDLAQRGHDMGEQLQIVICMPHAAEDPNLFREGVASWSAKCGAGRAHN